MSLHVFIPGSQRAEAFKSMHDTRIDSIISFAEDICRLLNPVDIEGSVVIPAVSTGCMGMRTAGRSLMVEMYKVQVCLRNIPRRSNGGAKNC